MLICKGDIAYKCGELKQQSVGIIRKIQFSIIDFISPDEARNIFEDDTFYFYDDVLNGRLIETNGTKLVGLSITYNADSTCNIIIRLTRRSC
jgi:hypothetical protein